MNFVFDVETTGLPLGKRSYNNLEAFENARLLSICWILVHNDKAIEQSYYVVKPIDFDISPHSIKIHGITKEFAMANGRDMKFVLEKFIEALAKCKKVVAHNIDFDASIVLSEMYRAGLSDGIDTFNAKQRICTMRKGKEVMSIKKFPKLGELYKYLYNEEITNAHDAQYDTLYCMKCFQKIFPQEKDVFFFGDKEVRLTKEQTDVVYADKDKNVLVIACAGSGKSSTMLCRIKYLLDNGVPESSVIMMTFTRDAANDMRDKLFHILGYKPQIKVGTIDSIAKSFTDNKSESLKHVSEYSHDFLKYLNTCGEQFFSKYKYIFIDEYQDINQVQFDIINSFYKNGVKVFAVGDDAQNIYSFRGSSIEFILNFDKHFENASVYKLSCNFRSTPEIVNLANASIEKNANQIPKTMVSAEEERCNKKPRVKYFSYSSHQNNYIVSMIKQAILAGTPEHKIAVLSPTNQPLFMIEELLTKEGIDHVLLEGKSDVRTRIKAGYVCLSTIHKSKGLEWDIVILSNMSDDSIPKIKNDGAIEEERRLFYVAVTRARKELHIFYYANILAPYVTRYVSELDKSLYHFEDVREEFLGNSLGDNVVIDKSVTKLIELLDGKDYIILRQNNILPEGSVTTTRLFKGHSYSSLIEKEEIYADFGIYVDYVISKMVCSKFKLKCMSKAVLQTLACVTLDNTAYNIYKLYRLNFKLNIQDACNSTNPVGSLEKGGKVIINAHKSTIQDIISKIKEHAYKYKMAAGDIPVFNFRFLPEGFDNVIRSSYETYKDKERPWFTCDEAIWNVSKCNRIVSDYRRRMLFKNIIAQDFKDYLPMFQDVEEHFVNKLEAHDVTVHECLQIQEGMYGELDLRLDDHIIDIKTSINEDLNTEWILQLLCYKILYEYNNPGCVVKKISVLNPLKGLLFDMNVGQWTKQKDLLQYLLAKREKMCLKCK